MKICFVSLDKYKHISQEFGEEGFVNISINYNNKYNVTYFYKYSIYLVSFQAGVLIRHHYKVPQLHLFGFCANRFPSKFQLSGSEAGSQDP